MLSGTAGRGERSIATIVLGRMTLRWHHALIWRAQDVPCQTTANGEE